MPKNEHATKFEKEGEANAGYPLDATVELWPTYPSEEASAGGLHQLLQTIIYTKGLMLKKSP